MPFNKSVRDYYAKKLENESEMQLFLLSLEEMERALEQRRNEQRGVRKEPIPATGGKFIKFRRFDLPEMENKK